MIYGIYDNRMDTETTISWLRSKKVSKGAMVSTADTPKLIPNLAAGDVVYLAGVDRFVSMERFYEVCSMIYQRNASIRFLAQPYLDMGNGKQWKPAVVRDIQSRIQIEAECVNLLLRKLQLNGEWSWYVSQLISAMNLRMLAQTYSSDGILKKGS